MSTCRIMYSDGSLYPFSERARRGTVDHTDEGHLEAISGMPSRARVETHEYRIALGTFSELLMVADAVDTKSRAEKLWG